jgi:lathosterol oxidase
MDDTQLSALGRQAPSECSTSYTKNAGIASESDHVNELSAPTLLGTLRASFPTAFLQASVVYYASAVFLHYVVPRVFRVSSVQDGRRRSPGQVTREAIASLGPLLVKSAAWVLVDHLLAVSKGTSWLAPYVTVHDDDSQLTLFNVVWMVVVLDLLHDAWFYWTHRLLHTKALYRHVHYAHHTSRVPTAFTGYSFHVLEACIVFLNEILICFFLPIHVRLHRYYHMYTTAIHCGGHAGYEIAPFVPSMQGMASLVLTGGKINDHLTTVRHHDLHHQYSTIHFGLYMTHWDNLMGTS